MTQQLGRSGGSFKYPGLKALAAHRISHFLWRHHCRLLARMHSQFWRLKSRFTQAQIAEGVFIDHGSGLVTETAVVEKGAMLTTVSL